MSKQHIHHVEIKAWADGAIIQTSAGVEWVDCKDNNPHWLAGNRYRVKPKPDVIYYSPLPKNLREFECIGECFATFGLKLTKGETPQDSLKLTFCGETGDLVNMEGQLCVTQ